MMMTVQRYRTFVSIWALGLLALAFAGACRQEVPPPDKGPGPAGDRFEQRQAPLTALSRSGWVLSSSPTGTEAIGNAIDGNATTRWRTGVAQATNQFFQVDMGSPRTFGAIRLDATNTATEFPRSYKVQAANDNVSWGTAPSIATGTGTTAVTTISFTPQTARYIRVTLTGSNAAVWSIHEFNVYDLRLSRTGWTATASVNNTNAGLAIDATASTRWNTVVGTNNTQVNGQSLTVNMAIAQTFNQLTLDTGSSAATQFPRGYSVTTSSDGTNFGAPIATGAGTGQLTVISFPTQVARYVRVTLANVSPSPFSTPWAVEELNVIGQPTSLTTQVRASWVLSASPNSSGNVPNNAIDGVTTTRWTTSTAQANGQFFQVDMGTYRTFNQVTLDAGTTTNNFPRNWQLQTSNNGTTWTTVTSGTGTAALVTISVQPQTARHIRINLTGSNTNPWSIQELNVAGQALSPPNWVASASSSSTGNGPANAIDGSASTRWSTSGAQTNSSLTVDMGTALVFNQLTLDAGTTPNNFPRNYSVFVSNDGANFGTAVATGTGTGQLVTINLLTQTARFILIQTPTTPANSNTWSIQELSLWRIAQPCDSVTCTASDACHVAGVCDPNSGVCSNPAGNNGATCNDGNACTQTDTCANGTCTGSNPKVCTASDACHVAGTCNPANGTCSNPAGNNGATCNDGNACTQTDTCSNGTCTGSNPVVCTASDTCHVAGTCNPANGTCSNPAGNNGATCNDGNACTNGTTCQNGACTGGMSVMCTASDQCHVAGSCSPTTGLCSNPAKSDGTTCNDGATCTQSETCQSGTCQASGQFPPILNLAVEHLGQLGGNSAVARNINASGQTVGWAPIASGQTHAFLTNPGGPMVDLGGQLGLPGNNLAYAINDGGTVVGHMTAPDGTHAFRYYSGGPLDDLGLVGDGSTFMDPSAWRGSNAFDVNSLGQVAGAYTDVNMLRGFRYTDGIGFEDIGSLAGGMTVAWAINASGLVGGSSWVPGTPQTFDERRYGHAVILADEITGLVDLNDLIDPLLGWTLSVVTDMAGDFVVGTGDRNGALRAYRLRLSTGVIDDISAGWEGRSFGKGVNSQGDAIGVGFRDAAGTTMEGFIYGDQVGFKSLNEMIDPASGWSLATTFAINDSGNVVGWGFLGGNVSAYRVRVPMGAQATCQARGVCGGGDGDAICLYSDGVVETSPGRFVAVFGFDNASSASVHPSINEVRLGDEAGLGDLVSNPQPAPPTLFPSGTHTGAYLPMFNAGQKIAWTVNSETITASASSQRLTPIVIGQNGLGVVIGGKTIIIRADLGVYSDIPGSPGPATPPERALGPAYNGALVGKFSVAPDGGATYAVPLTLPPGIAGMLPNLSFTYNSHMGNGTMGQGWQLTGLSFIYRCSLTRVQDGLARPVLMDDIAGDPDGMPGGHDGKCIDGKRIIGGRTEIDDISTITGDGQGAMIVTTKSGERRYYGSRLDTRVTFPHGSIPNDPNMRQNAIWPLDKVVDVWGNYYEIHYNDDRLTFYDQSDIQARGLIVTSIKYTGHEGMTPQQPFETLTFEYQDRKDVRTTRFHDSLLPQAKRLWKVNSSLGTYTLDYLSEKPLYPTRLSGITFCAAGSCLDPLTFDWEAETYAWDVYPETGLQSQRYAMPARIDHVGTPSGGMSSVDGVQFADLNGDGRLDFVQAVAAEDVVDLESAWENNGHGWTFNDNWRLPACLKAGGEADPCSTVLLDVNNDGVVDVANTGTPYNLPGLTLRVWINHIKEDPNCTFEQCWQEQTGWSNFPSGFGNIDLRPTGGVGVQDKFVDMDGDRVPDFVRIASTSVKVWLRKNNQWVQSFNHALGLQQGEAAQLADLNRDGLPDLLHLRTNGLTRGYLNTGEGFSGFYDVPEDVVSPGPGKGGIADIDGDGLFDRLLYETRGCNQFAFATVLSFSNGEKLERQLPTAGNYRANLDAYLPTDAQICAVGGFFSSGVGFADVNGDGLSDAIIAHPLEPGASYANQLLVNTGSTWRDINQSYDTPPAWTQFAGPNPVPLVPNRAQGIVAFLDLDGDGLEDIAASGQNLNKSWHNGFRRPVLKKFPNGLAKKTEVSYVTITTEEARTSGVYSDAPTLEPGTKHFAVPISVVKEVSAEDGTGTGTMATTSYFYSSLRASAFGRGPQGFRMVRVVEPPPSATERGNVTDTIYAQAYPFTGMPISVTRFKAGDAGTQLTITNTRYCAVNTATEATDCTTDTGSVAKNYPPGTSLFVYPLKITDKTPLHGAASLWDNITVTSDFAFDVVGNATQTTVTTTKTENGQVESFKKTVTNTYGQAGSLEQFYGKLTLAVARTEKVGTTNFVEHTTAFEYGNSPNARLPGTVIEVPILIKKLEEAGRLAPIELHTAYGYDEFGNIVATTSCASDLTNCDHAGATNPFFDPLNPDPAHPQFRTTTISFDPDLFQPPNQMPGTINGLNYGGRKGRFPVVGTNAVGHVEYYAYDPVKGVLLQKTGPNGIHTRSFYDGFGQKTSEVSRANSASPINTLFERYRRASSDPSNVATVTVMRHQTGETSWAYGDGLERKVASVTYGFDGTFMKTTTEFDAGGRVHRVSKPFAEGSGPSYFTTTHYDSLGRVSVVDDDLGVLDESGLDRFGKVTTTYFGSTIVTKRKLGDDEESQPRTEIKNAIGQLTTVSEGGTVISFLYDLDGNLTDAGDTSPTHFVPTVHTEYDRRGRKSATSDPDMGNWTYIYDGFGDMIEQTDAKNQKSRMSYDDVGRMITKTDLADTPQSGTSQWVYDIEPGGVGKLVAVVGAPDDRLAGPCTIPHTTLTDGKRVGRSYKFTPLGEVSDVTECSDGEDFVTRFQYDLGRQSRVIYPQVGVETLVVDYVHTNLGFLHYLKDPSTDTIYWRAKAINAQGQVTTEITRSGVETVSTRSPATGWLLASSTVAHAEDDMLIQSFRYGFDEVGNLRVRKRADGMNTAPWEESFGYDGMNRLTSSQIKVGGQDQPSQSYILDALGNLREKGGNVYTYGVCGAGPHATCGIQGGTPFAYDLNGNMYRGNDRTVTYNAANKPIRIVSHPPASNGNDTGFADFIYGADGNRVVQSIGPSPGNESARTVYVGLGGTGKSLYERTKRGSTTDHTQFIYAGNAHNGAAFALKVWTTDASSTVTSSAMKYQNFDHLGSVTAISDEQGHVVTPQFGGPNAGVIGYDAWGARRSPDGLAANPASFNLQPGHREFTGHETIPNVGLVNMNGRVYDPQLGRFLSADPNVVGVRDLQAYNRYSYVLNNPLRYTDPTGYAPTSARVMTAVYGIMAVVAFAVCAETGVTCVAGYAFMAMAIAVNAVEMQADGASWSQVALMVGISVAAGYVGGAIGGTFTQWGGNTLAVQMIGGAIAGGVASAITSSLTNSDHIGTNILEGAMMGALSAAAGWSATQAAQLSVAARERAQGGGGSGNAIAEATELRRVVQNETAAGEEAAYQSKMVMPSQRGATAFLPSYEPDSWNDGGGFNDGITVQGNSNCYAYALDKKGPFGLFDKHYGAYPGEKEGLLPMDDSDVTVQRVRARMVTDGLSTTPVPGGRLVYLVVEPGVDYHFYRLDNNGYFSHKPAWTPVMNTDGAGALITNPAAANHDYRQIHAPNYTQPGGWFWVPLGFSFPF